MHQPRLHSSQELTLHQINVEQSYHPRDVESSSGFPSAPSVAATLGADVVGGVGASAGLGGWPTERTPSSLYGGGPVPTLAQTPGGSSSTATTSIVRPDVRHRREWAAALADVDPFGLPGSRFLTAASEVAPVPVRYIADDHDRLWLAHRLDQYGTELGGALGCGVGKTGMMSSNAASQPRHGGSTVGSGMGTSLFEDLITAFELAAYYNPEIALERISSVDGAYLEHVHASPAVIADARQYWLRKREALGGHIPCIPTLKVVVREENQTALCRPEVLGDCPLPFKWRDWTVAVVNRKRGRSPEHPTRATGGDSLAATAPAHDVEDMKVSQKLVSSAFAISVEVLRRERLRRNHTDLTLFELASLRALGAATGKPNTEGPLQTPTLAAEPFTGRTEEVPVSVRDELTFSQM